MNVNNITKYIVAILAAAIFMGSAYIFPAETFLIFTAGWLFFIPAAFIVYMVYGFMAYIKEKKHKEHKIVVAVAPTEAMRAIALREAELKREKERLLYQEYEKLR